MMVFGGHDAGLTSHGLPRIFRWWISWRYVPDPVNTLPAVGQDEPLREPNLNMVFFCFTITSQKLLKNVVSKKPRHSQPYITSGLLNTADGYPTMTCKAFNGRLMLIFLDRCIHDLRGQNQNGDDPEIANACVAARALCGWFDLLERSPRYLSQIQRIGLYNFGVKFVDTLNRLAVLALLSNTSRWKIQPKLHVFLHVAEDHLTTGYNARYHHCFLDEDHIGLTKRLAQKVHRGGLMELRILCRWLLRLGSWVPSWWEHDIYMSQKNGGIHMGPHQMQPRVHRGKKKKPHLGYKEPHSDGNHLDIPQLMFIICCRKIWSKIIVGYAYEIRGLMVLFMIGRPESLHSQMTINRPAFGVSGYELNFDKILVFQIQMISCSKCLGCIGSICLDLKNRGFYPWRWDSGGLCASASIWVASFGMTVTPI